MALRPVVLIFAAALFLGACDAAGPDAFEEEVVVGALLVAGEPLPVVTLTRTTPIGVPFDSLASAIEGAEVTVTLLAADGSVEAVYPYFGLGLGRYGAANDPFAFVEPGQRYRLDVVAPGFEQPVTAETAVPDTFAVVRPPPDSVTYQLGPAPTFDVTPSAPEGETAVYVLTYESLDPRPENLTPLAAELFGERDVALENLAKTSSPLLNEATFFRNADGSVRVEVPWFTFNFFGPTLVTLSVLDDALAQYLEFQAIQSIPTTISPGEIPEVPTNVRNGVGVFGAVAQAEVTITVERP